MKYIDGFRNPGAAAELRARIHAAAKRLPAGRGPVHVMEVCGSHTMAIGRYGIRDLLPGGLDLISGPGCPVCVTSAGYVDAALELARRGIAIFTFGDLVNVPGSESTLAECRAAGATVTVCYSPLEALDFARAQPEREAVFLAIGFETTIPPVVSLVDRALAQGVKNLSLLTAFKTVPPALEALVADPELKIDAFLCPPHVSAIIGARAYEPFVARHHRPCVIAGFEPLDILLGLDGILEQLGRGEAQVENQYARVVTADGNPRAQALMARYLEPVDEHWRGLGPVPGSGLGLRPAYAEFDAARRHGVRTDQGREHPGCRCGDVIKGKIKPPQCPLFRRACTPIRPIGPCMVSSEGSCAAWFKYGRHDED